MDGAGLLKLFYKFDYFSVSVKKLNIRDQHAID